MINEAQRKCRNALQSSASSKARGKKEKCDTEGYTAIPIRLVSKLFEGTLWHTVPEVGRNLKVSRIDFGFVPAATRDCRV